MGGYIAIEILRQSPSRVSKIALLDTNARADTAEQSEKRRALMDLAKRGGFGKVTEMLLPALVNRARSYDPQVVGIVRTMARNIGATAFLDQEEAIIHRPDCRPWLGEVKCPALVLCGKQDSLTPPSLHVEMANAIPTAHLVVIEDCGHLSTIEQPEEVNSAMRAWINRDHD
jgi:pimeloyl-ACP methyl ester carboxylesterase